MKILALGLMVWAGAVVAAQAATPGQEWRAASGITFVWVPPGCFQMGNDLPAELPDYETGMHADEAPRHEACVAGFWLGKYEVTQGEWQQVMGSNPAYFKRGERYPVERVSWNQAQEFVAKLGSLDSANRYRLPTEAEWEYACRSGGKEETYAGGEEPMQLAWAVATLEKELVSAPVGKFAANGLGLFDMSGNVFEWVADGYHATGYATQRLHDPLAAVDASDRRVLRGGSYHSYISTLRCKDRGYDYASDRLPNIGLRVVRVPK